MTFSRSTLALLTVALLSTQAYAEGDDAAEKVDAPKPKIISSGQDAAGNHMFLAVTPKGPRVFHGDGKELVELDVLGMGRTRNGFIIDTLEQGELTFQTGPSRGVIRPGIPGFLSPRPTVVFGAKADGALVDQVMERIGGSAPKSSGVEASMARGAGAVRFPVGPAAQGEAISQLHNRSAGFTPDTVRAQAKQRLLKARQRLAPRAQRGR